MQVHKMYEKTINQYTMVVIQKKVMWLKVKAICAPQIPLYSIANICSLSLVTKQVLVVTGNMVVIITPITSD